MLAIEMAAPGSFSFKTLDVLKNLSSKEFQIFEKLASLELHHAIIEGDYLGTLGLDWETLQRLKDFGLISLDGSQRTVAVQPNGTVNQLICQSHVINISNNNADKQDLKTSCYLLTAPAQELLPLISQKCTDLDAIKIAEAIVKSDAKKQFTISLHRINWMLPNGQFNYQSSNLLDNH